MSAVHSGGQKLIDWKNCRGVDMSSGADSGSGGGGGSGFGYLNFNRVRCANPPPRRYESIEVDDEDDEGDDGADAEDEIMGLVGAILNAFTVIFYSPFLMPR